MIRPSVVLVAAALALVLVGAGAFMARLNEASAAGGGPEMRLTANGCAADCTFANGEKFTLAVAIVTAPAGGYIAAQSFIDYGPDLTYEAAAAADEIVWPDCDPAIALRAQTGPTFVNHGCLTGLTESLPASFYAGNLVELSLICSSGSSKTEVRLLPEGDPVAIVSGAAFVEGDGVTLVVPKVSNLSISCSAVLQGDTNCDAVINPLDAALILQLSAGLISALPCPGGGDPSGDGVTNPLDAALILQFSAGLISSLPP